MKELINKEIFSHLSSFNELIKVCDFIEIVAKECIQVIENGGKIILFGNGGSAADSQHIAAELVGRYKTTRKGLPAIALTTDSSALTSIANDFGYDQIFERQLQAISNKKDLVIGISTSGNSANVIKALNYAKNQGNIVIGLSGCDGGLMNDICNINIVAPSNDTPRIQEMHIFIGHTICFLIDNHFSN